MSKQGPGPDILTPYARSIVTPANWDGASALTAKSGRKVCRKRLQRCNRVRWHARDGLGQQRRTMPRVWEDEAIYEPVRSNTGSVC